jgi:TPR repeat protein
VKLPKILLAAAVLLLVCPVESGSQQEGRKVQQAPGSPVGSEMFGRIRADAEQGDVSAQANLGFMYFLGSEVPRDYEEAARWFRRAAEQNMAIAQFNLGMMYLEGKGVPRDYEEAAELLGKAAEQNIDAARFNLGMMYLNGKGVPYSAQLK